MCVFVRKICETDAMAIGRCGRVANRVSYIKHKIRCVDKSIVSYNKTRRRCVFTNNVCHMSL